MSQSTALTPTTGRHTSAFVLDMSRTDSTSSGRSRRVHRKSRLGCANCKLRRVKCDESKPECKRCAAFGVACCYKPGLSVMELPFVKTFKVDTGYLPRPVTQPPITLPLAQKGRVYQIRPTDMELLAKFRRIPIATNHPEARALAFQNLMVNLAHVHPWFMHTILAVVRLYSMDNDGQMDSQDAVALSFHFVNGISLFNARLSPPPQNSLEKDALWGAAMMLGMAACSDTREISPVQPWPLTPSSAQSLSWLGVVTRKTVVHRLANPSRPDSIFCSILAGMFSSLEYPNSVGQEEPKLPGLPRKLVWLCRLDETSTVETNPYHGPATALARVMPLECGRMQMGKFLPFLGSFDERFLDLLFNRDPCALLLLAYFYAKVWSPEQWWIYRRARYEGPAICTLLESRFAGDPELLALLDFPKATFASPAATRPATCAV